MDSDSRLKAEARRCESAGRYPRALELYQEVLRSATLDPDAIPDPTLCLKVADLHYRLDRPAEAMRGYREAAKLYEDLGLMVNAIAVWKKVARVFPAEAEPFRRLSELQLDMGLVAEARGSLRAFAEASPEETSHEDVVEALRGFLDRDPDPELAILLARRLASRDDRPEALETLRGVHARIVQEGRKAAELERELETLRQREP